MLTAVYEETDIDSIAFELKNFKVAIVLTDTIFGFLSVDKKIIYKIKKRKLRKKIISLISNLKYVDNLTEEDKEIVNKYWPGKITFVKDGKSYRFPNDLFLTKLISKTGPLFSSSANFSNRETVKSIEEAIRVFSRTKYAHNIIYINRQKKGHDSTASTIYSLDRKKIIRQGDVIFEK